VVYYGILKAGGVVVPLSVLLKGDEVAYHLQNSDSKAYFCFQGTPELPMGEYGFNGFENAPDCEEFFMIMANPADKSSVEDTKTLGQLMLTKPPVFESCATSESDTAIIIYTSGTTGRPKGAELTHSNMLLNALGAARDNLGYIRHADKVLTALPLFHIFGQTVLMNAGIMKGATLVLMARFDAVQAFELMEKEEITVFAGVPTMYWALLHTDTSSFDIKMISGNLKTCVSGGASLPVAVLHEFEKKYNVEILEGYGMSEGSPIVTFNHRDLGRKPGSVGTPFWGIQVRLLDDNGKEVPVGEKGELCYKGHNVMKGYYKNPAETEKTLKNGWLHSGDIAIKDEDGFYFIVDRTKDMIIRGGLNVYPREVERVMMKHDAISLVAVIGIPDEAMGEEVKAFVVLKPGKVAEPDDIIAWTKSKIASYKYPREVEILEALPMSATGKILKKELRK
jgi:long-chain acyl-CoA synthetase